MSRIDIFERHRRLHGLESGGLGDDIILWSQGNQGSMQAAALFMSSPFVCGAALEFAETAADSR